MAQHSSSRSKRPADFDKPRVYLANNCGGTSWIRDFAVELFEAHGYDIHMSLEVKTAGTPEGTTEEGTHTHMTILKIMRTRLEYHSKNSTHCIKRQLTKGRRFCSS